MNSSDVITLPNPHNRENFHPNIPINDNGVQRQKKSLSNATQALSRSGQDWTASKPKKIAPNLSPIEADLFRLKLRCVDKTATFRASESGSSGFTGIIKAKNPVASVFATLSDTGAVIKYVPSADAGNEKTCTDIAQAYGFYTPIIELGSKTAASLFVDLMQSEKPAFSPIPFEMLIMNLLPGENLFELCKSGKILELPQDAWNRLFFAFGRAAMLDLVIGNDDRFVRFEKKETGTYHLKSGDANLGNVMVSGTSMPQPDVRRIYMIDSTSLCMKRKPAPQIEEEDFGGLGMFDDLDDNSIEAPKSLPQATTSAQALPPVQPPPSEGLHRLFSETVKEFICGSKELENYIYESVLSSTLKTIAESSHRDSKDPSVQQLMQKMQLAKRHLNRGLADGLQSLQSLDFQESPAIQTALEKHNDLSLLLAMNFKLLNSEHFLPNPSSKTQRASTARLHNLMHGCFL